jgi:CheY-like chemotaxis protein
MGFFRRISAESRRLLVSGTGTRRAFDRGVTRPPDKTLVLVVEDDPAARKLLVEFLEFNGFATIAVASGEEALPIAAAERPDLVLLDIGLPGIDGWETLRRLQSTPLTAGIPVVVVTAYDTVEDLIRGYSSGVRYYVAKPYQQDELLRGLRMALSSP